MAAGDLWVVGLSPNAVYRSQDDGATWGSAITGPAGQTILTGIAFAANGDLWVAGDPPMRSTGPRMTVPLGVRQSQVRQGRQPLPALLSRRTVICG